MMPRLALTGLVLVVGWAAYALVDLLYLQPSALHHAEIAGLRETLVDYDRRLATARDDLRQLSSPPGLEAAIYSDAAADGALWLQAHVRDLLATAGGTAIASQTGTSPLLAGHDKVALTLRANISEDGLFRFLADVETTLPLLVVETMMIDAGPAGLDVTATIFMVTRHAPAA